MSLADFSVRIILQAANDVKDGVLGEHHLEESVLVEQEYVFKDLKEVMEALHVLEVFANVEEVQQLSNVAFHLQRCRQLFSPYR